MGKLFGTDGVRGVANTELTGELAYNLGRAGAYVLTKETAHAPKILVGMDTRISGDMLESALVAGICSVGAHAIIAGIVPTPAVAYLVRKYNLDAGVVISASHNPVEYNGIKFFNNEGYKLRDELENEIEDLLLKMEEIPVPVGKDVGTKSIAEDALDDYIDFLTTTTNTKFEGIKVAIDCANGASYKAAPLALRELGAELILINVEPNGTNINDNCGAVYPENMAKAVIEHGADVGISFDGDADRVVFADEKGNIVDGDKIMGICAIDMMEHGTLKNNTIVATVMSNLGFEYSMNKKGIKLIRSQVGDRYVMEDMLKYNCNLGGEQSGHLIFSDFNTTGDGLISAMQVLGLLIKKGKSLSELCSFIETYPQVLNNVLVDKKVPIEELTNTSELISKVEKELGTSGRLLVRYSGTENKLRVMLEGKDEKIITAYAKDIADTAVNEIKGK